MSPSVIPFDEARKPRTIPFPSREARMIGPEISAHDMDAIELVLAHECARRKVSATGHHALHLERMLRYAYSMGMNKKPELEVFIRNLSD